MAALNLIPTGGAPSGPRIGRPPKRKHEAVPAAAAASGTASGTASPAVGKKKVAVAVAPVATVPVKGKAVNRKPPPATATAAPAPPALLPNSEVLQSVTGRAVRKPANQKPPPPPVFARRVRPRLRDLRLSHELDLSTVQGVNAAINHLEILQFRRAQLIEAKRQILQNPFNNPQMRLPQFQSQSQSQIQPIALLPPSPLRSAVSAVSTTPNIVATAAALTLLTGSSERDRPPLLMNAIASARSVAGLGYIPPPPLPPPLPVPPAPIAAPTSLAVSAPPQKKLTAPGQAMDIDLSTPIRSSTATAAAASN